MQISTLSTQISHYINDETNAKSDYARLAQEYRLWAGRIRQYVKEVSLRTLVEQTSDCIPEDQSKSAIPR